MRNHSIALVEPRLLTPAFAIPLFRSLLHRLIGGQKSKRTRVITSSDNDSAKATPQMRKGVGSHCGQGVDGTAKSVGHSGVCHRIIVFQMVIPIYL